MAASDRKPTTANPTTANPTTANPTAEQLRAAIDRGATRDKVRVGDPAAAPLGTDAEAAGTPTSPDQVAAAGAAELGRPMRAPARRSDAAIWSAVAIAIVAVILALVFTLP